MTVKPKFRVATYNIHKGVLNDLFGFRRVSVIHELRDRLHDLQADLVFLQEVQGQNRRNASRFDRWPDEPQDVFLARSPELRHVFESAYGNNAQYLHGHHGNALLSKFPILHRENRDVSDHVLEKRGVLHCVVQIDSQPVHCFVVHFGLLARSRVRQVDALIEWVINEVPDGTPLIIGGDFNDWQNRLSGRICRALNTVEVFDNFQPRYRRIKQVARYVTDHLGMPEMEIDKPLWQTERRVKSARTYPSLVPWFRMDRLYVRGFDVVDADVLRGPVWAKLSDHSPLIADLNTPPPDDPGSKGL